MTLHINGISLVSIVILAFFGLALFSDRQSSATAADLSAALPVVQPTPGAEAQPTAVPDPAAIRYPYAEYILTQGPHGQSYGQLAIDLTAGKGALILAPISGTVSALYVDEYNNTTLILDNDYWQVLLLHGDYSVQPGESVAIGQVIGNESNHGYTVDWQGNLCAGRDCGYHTHLNVFSKLQGQNVNPLDVLTP